MGDHYKDIWPKKYPDIFPDDTNPDNWTKDYRQLINPQITKEEFDREINALKEEMKEMKELLKMAKIIDEKTNQPDCEMEDKVKFIKDLAKHLDVDLDGIFS